VSQLPIVLIHGYSSSARALHRWRDALVAQGRDATTVHLGEYISLSNEITIKDIAEGFDRALRTRAGLDADEPFDAIVHSTGGLVIREWLTTYSTRRARLKRMIALAPATFGSPMAHKGRSWLGAVFKGGKTLGPDFMEAGQLVLSGLELGSRYTWELAHRDLLGATPVYDASEGSPFPFVFVGLEDYGRLKRAIAGEPGTDGTVRWAGAGFHSRKIVVDLTREPGTGDGGNVSVAPWSNIDVPLVLVPDLNHGTIMSEPSDELVAMVSEALAVDDMDAYRRWSARHSAFREGGSAWTKRDKWQQFVLHTVDERGDPVPDYYVEIGNARDGQFKALEDFSLDTHTYSDDPSFRCFHVDLAKLEPDSQESLCLRLIARSGTELVAYHGAGSEAFKRSGVPTEEPGDWDAMIELSGFLRNTDVSFFFPYTTTLVEIRLNREPMPPSGPVRLMRFVADA
jgi:pimeloyl-ACP methyl ester carboxylesterase